MTYKLEDVTPRPWVVKTHKRPADGIVTARIGKRNETSFRAIARMQNTLQEVNAQHIVHCVNNHETLVALVEELVDFVPRTIREGDNPKGLCPTMYHTGTHSGDARLVEKYKKATETLNKIKGE